MNDKTEVVTESSVTSSFAQTNQSEIETMKTEMTEMLNKPNPTQEEMMLLIRRSLTAFNELQEERDAAYEMLYANQFVLDEETKEWQEN